VVANATKAGLSVILDEHDFNPCSEDPAMCRAKLGAFWAQVAPRYAKAPRNVAFEILNEPHAKLDAAMWNSVFADMLALVRKTNPDRIVVVGPTNWNGYRELPTLHLPADPNLLVTFHYYEPMQFTHQGAPWVESEKNAHGVTWGNAADRAVLRSAFDQVASWSAANHRPVLLGEFGAYDKSGTPMPLRVAYTQGVRCEAERHGFGWAYWQFDSDFIVWDMKANGWVKPIKDALVPASASRSCRP
jgi:endoglucanase